MKGCRARGWPSFLPRHLPPPPATSHPHPAAGAGNAEHSVNFFFSPPGNTGILKSDDENENDALPGTAADDNAEAFPVSRRFTFTVVDRRCPPPGRALPEMSVIFIFTLTTHHAVGVSRRFSALLLTVRFWGQVYEALPQEEERQRKKQVVNPNLQACRST